MKDVIKTVEELKEAVKTNVYEEDIGLAWRRRLDGFTISRDLAIELLKKREISN
jgi:hypothetical protein